MEGDEIMTEHLVPLIIEPFDRESLEASIENALLETSTRVFLDTSTLIWLFRLHDSARKEVVDWITDGPQASKVHIPRRALHEFSRHRRDSNVLLPFKQSLKALPALLNQLEQWAHLITDDARAIEYGFTSRANYLSEVRNLSTTATRLVRPIDAASSLAKLDTELIPIFNSLALDGNIYAEMTDLQRAYEARAEARMPPGFKDLKKARRSPEEDEAASMPELAGANRFGDYVIWEEILQFCADQDEMKSVIILTHDQKPDWSYTPQKVIDNDGRSKPNPKGPFRVTVAHPLLAHEAHIRANIENLHIITVPQLASVASRRKLPLSLTELSRAVQVETEATIDAEAAQDAVEPAAETAENDGAIAELQPTGEPPVEAGRQAEIHDGGVVEFLRNLPVSASADRLYTSDPAALPAMDDVIRRLKSSDWYTQNPAAEEGLELLRGGVPSLLQAFIYGRNIYQAASGSAGTPFSILEDMPSEFADISDDLANAVYAGALFEVYFSKDGAVRPRPKSKVITGLFAPQEFIRFRPAIEAIRHLLAAVVDHYLIPPAPRRIVRTLQLEFDENDRITGVNVDGVALTEPYDDSQAGAETLRDHLSYERLRDRLAEHFALPTNQFLVDPPYEGSREIVELQLRDWGPTTELKFPSI